MANPEGESPTPHGAPGSQMRVPTVWNVPAGPPPLVNQFMVMSQPDADGGPGEIVVHLGYSIAPPSAPKGAIPVTTVASIALTRHRAAQLVEFLNQQIENWDKGNAAVRRQEGRVR
jgi:hypothetical protein